VLLGFGVCAMSSLVIVQIFMSPALRTPMESAENVSLQRVGPGGLERIAVESAGEL
jgi:hypothetical protein